MPNPFKKRAAVRHARQRSAMQRRVKKEKARNKAYIDMMKETMDYAKDYDWGEDKK